MPLYFSCKEDISKIANAVCVAIKDARQTEDKIHPRDLTEVLFEFCPYSPYNEAYLAAARIANIYNEACLKGSRTGHSHQLVFEVLARAFHNTKYEDLTPLFYDRPSHFHELFPTQGFSFGKADVSPDGIRHTFPKALEDLAAELVPWERVWNQHSMTSPTQLFFPPLPPKECFGPPSIQIAEQYYTWKNCGDLMMREDGALTNGRATLGLRNGQHLDAIVDWRWWCMADRISGMEFSTWYRADNGLKHISFEIRPYQSEVRGDIDHKYEKISDQEISTKLEKWLASFAKAVPSRIQYIRYLHT